MFVAQLKKARRTGVRFVLSALQLLRQRSMSVGMRFFDAQLSKITIIDLSIKDANAGHGGHFLQLRVFHQILFQLGLNTKNQLGLHTHASKLVDQKRQ